MTHSSSFSCTTHPDRAQGSVKPRKARSVISVLPKVTLPPSGPNIRFWKAKSSQGDNAEPSLAERHAAIKSRVADLSHVLGHIGKRAGRSDADACIERMRNDHAALTELSRHVTCTRDNLTRLQVDLQARPGRLLAGWRVTEREILSANTTMIQADLDELSQAVKRLQVDLASRLIELT